MSMKNITYKVFLTSMFFTAGMFLFLMWTGFNDQVSRSPLPQIMFTSFTIGLASFLLWITRVLSDIRKDIKNRDKE